jgi:hypothetical protein
MYLTFTTEDNKTCVAVITREANMAIIMRFDDLESLRLVLRTLKDMRVSLVSTICTNVEALQMLTPLGFTNLPDLSVVAIKL